MSLTTNLQADFLLRKGQSFAEKDKFAEALVAYDKALQKHPDYNLVHLYKGLALSRFNKYKEAVASVELAINSNPSNDIFWYHLGVIHLEHQNYESAIKALEQARKLDPSYNAPLPFIGLCKMAGIGAFEDGYSIITKNNRDLRYNGYEPILLFFCETFLFNKGGKKPLPQQIEFELSGFDKVWFDICSLIENLFGHSGTEGKNMLFGELSSAIRYHLKVFHPTFAKHYFQGEAKILKGDLDGALVCFSTAIDCDKKMVEAYKQQIQIYFDKGAYDEALKASAKVPEEIQDSEILCAQGLMLYNLERYKEAVDIFKRLCTECPRDFLSFYYCGLCLIAIKEESAALERFDKAVKLLHPDLAMQKLKEVYALQRKLGKN